MIRVGIDASQMLISRKTGMEKYTEALVLGLVDELKAHAGIELALYFYTGNRLADPSLLHGYQDRLAAARIRVYSPRRGYRLGLPVLAALDRLDLLHIPSPCTLWFAPCPLVMTVHDVVWAHLPPDGQQIEGRQQKRDDYKAIGQAAAIITDSQSTKQDVVEQFHVAESRLHVVPLGVGPNYRPAENAAAQVQRKYGLGHYILNVAALQYRKNQVRLLQAFAQLRETRSVDHKLVIAGTKGWGHEAVYAEHERLKLGDSVVFLGYVPDEDLPALYTAADLVIYPSLWEGFGLPILEAMACGAVVATSDCSSMPEVAGDAAIYFAPFDVTQMASAMWIGLTDVDLRAQLHARAVKRLSLYSWQQTARQTISAYQTLLASGSANKRAG